MKSLLTGKWVGPDVFTGESHQSFKELTPIFSKFFQKMKEEQTFLNSFSQASLMLLLKPDKDITEEKTIY